MWSIYGKNLKYTFYNIRNCILIYFNRDSCPLVTIVNVI